MKRSIYDSNSGRNSEDLQRVALGLKAKAVETPVPRSVSSEVGYFHPHQRSRSSKKVVNSTMNDKNSSLSTILAQHCPMFQTHRLLAIFTETYLVCLDVYSSKGTHSVHRQKVPVERLMCLVLALLLVLPHLLLLEGLIEAVESLRNNQAFDLVKLVDNPLDTDTMLSSTTLFKRIKRNVENEVNSLFQKAGDSQKYPTQGN
uniref:Uncharacterized protein n=1 Tax=Timema bartmani TaxID=61472 RepID=A0A7R9FAA6_9NEOP|nr:unnamed protein product [Timema bartmani]